MSKAAVLGASGFIGTRLVQHLASQGYAVTAVDIAAPRVRVNGVRYEEADVRQSLDTGLAVGVDVIFNLAATHRTPGHPFHEYYDTNVLGALETTRLAERTGVNTIVFTSSISVYGPSEAVMEETSVLDPISAYGRSKRQAEAIHQAWRERAAGRRLIMVRPAVVFGPGERGNYTFLANALRRGYFFYPGRSDTVKSGGYVDELINAIEFSLRREEDEILFNFAYPAMSSTQDIVEAFNRVLGRHVKPLTVPLAPMLAAAGVFEGLGVMGLKTPIHRERIMKLVQSTKIAPRWLLDHGYIFQTDLELALRRWQAETNGKFD